MKSLKRLLHAGKIFVYALAGWLLFANLLFAQNTTPPSESKGEGGGSWIASYFLTGLGVVLGMLVVCRASTRRDRIRPEAYAENKVGVEKDKK